jgi:hypothetical protein
MNLASLKANWSTTVTGLLVALSGFATFVAGFADKLGALGDLIPAQDRSTILLISGIATAFATALHGTLTKDASVSGNGTVNAPAKVAQSDGTNKVIAPLIVALLLPALFLSGCVIDPVTGKKTFSAAKMEADFKAFQANPNVQAAERAAGAAVLSFITSAATTEVAGNNFDSSFAIGAAMNSISAAVRTLPNDQAASLVSSTAQNFAQDTSTKPVARKLAQAYLAANPQTPAEKTAVVVALGTGATNGATSANLP